jgi:flagellar motility protein MotE (MotC chaperone)
MKNGYQDFFKAAQKNTGLTTGKPSKQAKQKFELKDRTKAHKPSRSGSPEDQMRAVLAERAKTRKSNSLRKKREMPIFPVICTTLAIVACAVGYFRPDLADKVIGKVEIGAFGNAEAAEDKTKAVEALKAPPAKTTDAKVEGAATPAATAPVAKTDEVPNFKEWTPEELSFFNKLNDRKNELDQRESELSRMEEELQRQKTELDQKIKQLESMRVEISKTLKTRVASDQVKVDKLVEVYSSMKPQQAAKVIETLNEDLAIEVLDKLKKKSAAEILNMMDSKKARRLSELMTGYQRTPAAEEAGEGAGEAAGDTKN